MTDSRYEVGSSGYGDLQERDPLGANTGITDPYEPQGEDPVNPKYSSLVNSEQSLFLDGGGDPFNPKGGCELDGMPIDCGRLQQRADGGSVGADIIGSNGRLSRHVYLTGSDIIIGGGSLSVYIPGRNDAPPPAGQQDDGTAWGTLDRWETVYFADVATGERQRETLDKKGPSKADVDCANKLAKLFSEGSAVSSAGVYDPGTLLDEDGTLRRDAKELENGWINRSPNFPEQFGHGAAPLNSAKGTSDRGGIIHVYPNPEGVLDKGERVGVFVPDGFKRITSVKVGKKIVNLSAGSGNNQYFHNPSLGLYIGIAHATKGIFGSRKNSLNSNLIGYHTMGLSISGGGPNSYSHIHVTFYSEFNGNNQEGTRADPRKYFCKEFGF